LHPERTPATAQLRASLERAAHPRHRQPPRTLRPLVSDLLQIFPDAPIFRRSGGVAEWLKAHAWKVCIRGTVSRVRIPLPPPIRPGATLSVAGCGVEKPAELASFWPKAHDPTAEPEGRFPLSRGHSLRTS